MMVDDLEVGGHDLARSCAHLQAVVQVVAMDLAAQVLVEPDVAYGPWRKPKHEPVDGVDWAGARIARQLLVEPGERGDLTPAEFPVAMGERRPCDRSLPPGDAADIDCADASHDRHVRIL